MSVPAIFHSNQCFHLFFFNLGDVQEMAARLLQLEQENAKVIVRSC